MTTAATPGEDTLIALLARALPTPRQTRLTIGDDAAAIPLDDGQLLLMTTDMLMENVHFRLCWDDLPALGWKALAQNLSDIAAMGGTPTHAVIALAVPPNWPAEQAVALYRGIADLAAQTHTDIVGGDTIRSVGPLTITITVLGRVKQDELLTRAGARMDDALFVSGTLGRAAAGLCVLETTTPYPQALTTAVQAQLRPLPRLDAARALAQTGRVSAMMDLSDGLATDLHRLCTMSQLGATVELSRIPIDPVITATVSWLSAHNVQKQPTELALYGGEDFELLFTAPADAEGDLRQVIAPLPLTRIGRMHTQPDLWLADQAQTVPLNWGFTHF